MNQAEGFKTFCLQGVTGSGKTEVYLQAMSPLLAAGKQVLVLVPEIALTPQTVQRFEERFNVPVICLHSELTDKKRLEAWSQAYCGHARIIIGTRSAVFVPLKNPGMIVIDEAHDPSFKQQSGFRYSARDVAIRRAQMENLPIILGSATPSLETLMNVRRGRFEFLSLPERAGEAKPPKMTMVDLRDKKLNAGLSDYLIETIREHLKQNTQVLLFLNRRGYAPTLMCHHCGWMAVCARCDARMTLHKNPTRLFCHHCGSQARAPQICNSCEQADLSDIGVGTEQLEQALANLFPDEKIVRIDRDSTRKKGSLQEKLDQIHSGEAKLLIGTQMLSKGHHFANLSLVAIVDADGGLYGTDFRSMERMAQLIVQVSGRAGREERVGEVLIQTHHPDNALLQLLLKKGYSVFADAVLKEREVAALPPFTHFALLRAEAIGKELPLNFLRAVKQNVSHTNVQLLGPIPAPMERRAGRYRAQLLIQSSDRAALHVMSDLLIEACQNLPLSRKVRWSLDIDPQEML
ncbi:MAG: primosomal protein N' [Coxiellaceae bacterium]|nr:primosomal protein N' [Coxiellaceae bacterium]